MMLKSTYFDCWNWRDIIRYFCRLQLIWLLGFSVQAQESNCLDNLPKAETRYEQGFFEEVIRLLQDCRQFDEASSGTRDSRMAQTYSRAKHRRALKLLALAYLALEQPKQAKSIINNVWPPLEFDPNTDPAWETWDRAPYIKAGAFPPQQLRQGTSLAINLNALIVDDSPGGLRFRDLTPRSGKLATEISGGTLVIGGLQPGTETVAIQVSDGAGQSAELTFPVTVYPAFERLQFLPDTTLAVGASYSRNLNWVFDNPGNEPRRFSASLDADPPNTFTAAVENGRLTVTARQPGQARIDVTISVADSAGGMGYAAHYPDLLQIYAVPPPEAANAAALSDTLMLRHTALSRNLAQTLGGERFSARVIPALASPDSAALRQGMLQLRGESAGLARVEVQVLNDDASPRAVYGFRLRIVDEANLGGLPAEDLDKILAGWGGDPSRIQSAGRRIAIRKNRADTLNISELLPASPVQESRILAVKNHPADVADAEIQGTKLIITGKQQPQPEAETPEMHLFRIRDRRLEGWSFPLEMTDHAPVLRSGQLADSSALALAPGAWIYPMRLDELFLDPDGDRLTYRAASADPQIAEVDTALLQTGVLKINGKRPGKTVIEITASDDAARESLPRQVFQVTVKKSPSKWTWFAKGAGIAGGTALVYYLLTRDGDEEGTPLPFPPGDPSGL